MYFTNYPMYFGFFHLVYPPQHSAQMRSGPRAGFWKATWCLFISHCIDITGCVQALCCTFSVILVAMRIIHFTPCCHCSEHDNSTITYIINHSKRVRASSHPLRSYSGQTRRCGEPFTLISLMKDSRCHTAGAR